MNSENSPAPMEQRFPALAKHVHRMAKERLTGSLADWESFLSDLNAALPPPTPPTLPPPDPQTPLTDADECLAVHTDFDLRSTFIVRSSFARTLERDLTATRQQLEEMRKERDLYRKQWAEGQDIIHKCGSDAAALGFPAPAKPEDK